MNSQTATSPCSKKHRWLRYSLRTLLVAITLFCAWIGHHAHRARRQAAAIAAIESLGGTVIFHDQRNPSGSYDHSVRPTPSKSSVWLRRVLGDEYFRRVAVVDLNMSAKR